MTISGALSNAMSGLRAAGRGAEVVSSNISNALTPGYARRVLNLSSSTIGNTGGVRIDGISRIMDAGLASDRRLAEAEQTNVQGSVNFYQRIEGLLGTPDNPASLAARLSGFESALITAISRPDANERLEIAVSEVRGLVAGLNAASAGIQEARTTADQNIGQQVDLLNTSLQQVAALNAQITATQVQGGDATGLQDQRQQVIDQIGVLVPVREVSRDNGQVGLYTVGGAVLLDGSAATVGFEPSNLVTPYMSLESNTLSGITINGIAVNTDNDRGALRGGSIAAQFQIRDELGVSAQTQVDAIARDLVERFQDPSVDPSLSIGDAGLLTDSGGAFDPANERGLSDRIRLNASVDVSQGGEAWRIRDGMNATIPGSVGDATLLRSLSTAISSERASGSAAFSGATFTASSFISSITSSIGAKRTTSEQQLSFASARLTELTERQLADGVDTDAEFQNLLLVEQSFAANARMIQAADEMMQTILGL